ncbi:MAG: hypothetical protein ACE5I1_29170, partial [bacterium]
HQISAPVPVPDQPDARKLTYSFPLRSYGKPRIEKKTENDTAPSKQEDTKSQLKNDMEEGTSSDIISTHLTDQAQQAKTEPQEPITPPKIPQVQKADAKIPLQKPQPKRIEQKSFTDLEHLIPKQKPPQKQHEANPVENPSIKIDKRISTETKTILADYFENKQIENPKFVLIGTERKFIEPFAANLLDGNTLNESKSQVFEYFAAREQRLNPSITFTLIGVTMEKQFTHLLDKISSDLAGCVLLIDASDKSKLNYISYLHTTLKEKYDCDYGIAIYDGANNRNLALDTVKDLIGAKEEDLVMKLEKNNERDHLHFLREMLNETKKNTHNR